MPGQPRSTAEIVFAAALVPCEGCRSYDVGELELIDTGDGLLLLGPCPRCRRPRQTRFDTAVDPRRLPPPPRLELGGPEPSTLIRPAQLVAELDRLAPLIEWRPEELGPATWRANGRLMDRAATCLVELLKFVPAGAGHIPDDALDDAGRDDRAARPERYERAWLAAERDRYLELIERSIAQAERIWALEGRG